MEDIFAKFFGIEVDGIFLCFYKEIFDNLIHIYLVALTSCSQI